MGLTRLLGRHGGRISALLAAAAVLFIGACVVGLLLPSQPATAGLIFIVPVAIIASELGTRAGLLAAALSVAVVAWWLAHGPGLAHPAAQGTRSIAMFFLAWVIGRTSDRAARSRRLLEQVLEASTDSIYVKDLEGRYLVVNSATADLLKRPADTIVGRSNTELAPEMADAVAEQDSAVLDVMTPATYEITGTFGSERRVLSVSKSPFRDAAGNAIGSLGIARDVTEARRMQEHFRRAFEDAPIGMAVCDLEGRFLDVNQALCRITGYGHEDLCGGSFASITHPDDLETDHAVMHDLISGLTSSSTDEKRYIRADGSLVWVARSVTLVRDSDGTPLHFLDQIQDITERKGHEDELRRLADQDPLTGLYNRRRFGQELDRHVAEVARYGPRGALLILDLDDFKRINDSFGHHVGDELITQVARILKQRLRTSDILARLGGDEFAVLVLNDDVAHAQLVAGELVECIRGQAGVPGYTGPGEITASVGVAPFGPDRTSSEQILVAADLAMYEAKRAGRDGFALAAPAQRREPHPA